MSAGSSVTGVGALFYVILLMLGVVTRHYKERKSSLNNRSKYIFPIVFLFVITIAILSSLNAYRIIDLKNIFLNTFFQLKKDTIYMNFTSKALTMIMSLSNKYSFHSDYVNDITKSLAGYV